MARIAIIVMFVHDSVVDNIHYTVTIISHYISIYQSISSPVIIPLIRAPPNPTPHTSGGNRVEEELKLPRTPCVATIYIYYIIYIYWFGSIRLSIVHPIRIISTIITMITYCYCLQLVTYYDFLIICHYQILSIIIYYVSCYLVILSIIIYYHLSSISS